MAGGFLLAAPWLGRVRPEVGRIAARVQPFVVPLGMALVAGAGLSFLIALARLAPLDHLLLQGLAFLVGAVLLRGVIEERTDASRIRQGLARLAGAAQPIGVAAACFGLLHFAFGWAPLI